MPSKSQVLLKFQQDLQELNARFEDEIAAIEGDRLRKFRALSESRALVEGADLKTAEAVAERKGDRERATTGRDQAVAVATQKRRVALEASQKAWRKAEEQLESARDDARLQESRRHEDKLGEIDAILPMYKQARVKTTRPPTTRHWLTSFVPRSSRTTPSTKGARPPTPSASGRSRTYGLS